MAAEGVYEQLLTDSLEASLASLRFSRGAIRDEESARVLGAFIGTAAARRLASLKPEDRVAATNALLAAIDPAGHDRVIRGPEHLLAVARQEAPGVWALLQTRPTVPLSQPALLTNSHRDPKLGNELRAELATADRVDLLCAFVKWYGLRILEEQLHQLRTRGRPMRVLTTTYMGATERKALDRLVTDFGAEVRINYETQSTRLHAKAWLFRRDSGFDTAYVGSSNLSRAALLDGLEWNVRIAGSHTPELITKFASTFDGYWADPSFVPYDPATDGDRLDDALAVASGRIDRTTATFAISGLQVRPFPHQQEILDRLEVERTVHDRHSNLVVAATGTGKTVIAALDFQRLQALDPDLSLLFVAHRQELLGQAQRTYREVLADGNFGETYVGGARPERWRHVFASVQSLQAYGVTRLPADHFDVVVVDEFHHAEAATYRRILDHLAPRELLGLTATPERADGRDVRDFFDGLTAAELRLWDALEADLLCPFHYFGIADPVDLSQLEWRRGDYDTEALERVYTADDARVRIVLRQLADKVLDPRRMRALGFCVSVLHAEFMASRFLAAGIEARAVTGATPPSERAAALAGLRDGSVQVLFTVDLFNEGLDVPDVDTLLLLRPTQSATVFLQQLGRGLRRTADKPVLTVLDLIGQQRREFRFAPKLTALTGVAGKRLEQQVETGFAFLPSGCEIVLDRVAQATILDSVRRQLNVRKPELVAELRAAPADSLASWLAASGRDLSDVLRNNGSWTALRRAAGLPMPPAGPLEASLLKRVGSVAHVDDPERAAAYTRLLSEPVAYDELPEREQRFARMLFFSLWPNGGGFATYQAGFDALALEPAVTDELCQLIALGLESAAHAPRALEPGMEAVTMSTHAHYNRSEILAALDHATLKRTPSTFREGVVWSEPMQTDAFFITINKTEGDYSPTTMYADYAISPELFHWESQSTTSADGPTGQRYIHHRARGTHVLLLVRETRANAWNSAAPYSCLGPAAHLSHIGSRPIAASWRLNVPMRIAFFREAAQNT